MESVHGTVAGLDVHKKTVVAVVLQRDHSDEDHAAGVFGTTRYGLNELIAFLRQHGVTHAAMESTAQYWRPVWMALEGQFTLTLAQARSTRAPRGRKTTRTSPAQRTCPFFVVHRLYRKPPVGAITINGLSGHFILCDYH